MEHSYRDRIAPLPAGVERPMWSVMIPTFNCAHFLGETLESVLAQDWGRERMQIEVVDDASTNDDPAAIVAEFGRGRVGFYRQPQNVGHTANFNTCLQRARGMLVHLLHGDDYVRNGFYRRMEVPFHQHAEVGAAFCRDIRVDENGHWQTISRLLQAESGIAHNWLERIAAGQRLQTPSMVVRRAVYERLGGFDRRLRYCEDWEMWVRIAAHYPVWHEVEPLAVYRIRSTSVSGVSVRTGENGSDIRRAIVINQAHLSNGPLRRVSRIAAENFALACLRRANRLFEAGERQAALAQMREAWKSSRSLKLLLGTMSVMTLWALTVLGIGNPVSSED